MNQHDQDPPGEPSEHQPADKTEKLLEAPESAHNRGNAFGEVYFRIAKWSCQNGIGSIGRKGSSEIRCRIGQARSEETAEIGTLRDRVLRIVGGEE